MYSILSMSKNNKLELYWTGKNLKKKIEPRILVKDHKKSYSKKISNKDINNNILINGDNLLALKALEVDFSNKIKCIYIDPPYNTGAAYKEYDDGLENSIWLSLMSDRLSILKNLLKPDGVIFLSIDDDQAAYLKVLLDEIFGRKNFCGTFIWEKKKKPSFLSNMGNVTEYIYAYSKDRSKAPDFIKGETKQGKWTPINNAGNGLGVLNFPKKTVKFQCKDQTFKPKDMSEGKIITKLLDEVTVKNGTNQNDFRLEGEFRYNQNKINEIINQKIDQLIISKDPFRPNHIKNTTKPKKITNLLSIAHHNMSTNEDATNESREIFGSDMAFSYPKPEKLIKTLIECVTKEGDIVLDSFAGSGTTGAVAHKLKRRWIMIELGDHCTTHILPRIKNIIDGKDSYGISKGLNAHDLSGGGFDFFNLAPSLLKQDKWQNWIINKDYDEEMLIKAMCIHFGFDYVSNREKYWMHGKSSNTDYIYIYPKSINRNELEKISLDVGKNHTVLICSKSFPENIEDLNNLSIKKIPNSILQNCEWDKNNYSFEKILKEKLNQNE